jgi:hypothetical protein
MEWSRVELSWESTTLGQLPAAKNLSMEAEDIVESRYKTTGEHTTDWEDLSLCCSELEGAN